MAEGLYRLDVMILVGTSTPGGFGQRRPGGRRGDLHQPTGGAPMSIITILIIIILILLAIYLFRRVF
jgi:LPXTG-motif cell wall-anchored protein